MVALAAALIGWAVWHDIREDRAIRVELTATNRRIDALVLDSARHDTDLDTAWQWMNQVAADDKPVDHTQSINLLDRPTPAQQAAPTRPDMAAQPTPRRRTGAHRYVEDNAS